MSPSQVSFFSERIMRNIGHDHMIQKSDPQQIARFMQPLCDGPIIVTGMRRARRVIVGHDNRNGA